MDCYQVECHYLYQDNSAGKGLELFSRRRQYWGLLWCDTNLTAGRTGELPSLQSSEIMCISLAFRFLVDIMMRNQPPQKHRGQDLAGLQDQRSGRCRILAPSCFFLWFAPNWNEPNWRIITSWKLKITQSFKIIIEVSTWIWPSGLFHSKQYDCNIQIRWSEKWQFESTPLLGKSLDQYIGTHTLLVLGVSCTSMSGSTTHIA